MRERTIMSDAPKLPGLPEIDVNEYGGKKDGVRQMTNRRLFMQLIVFRAKDGNALSEIEAELAKKTDFACVAYVDANDPLGFGLLTWGEDPAVFVDKVRPIFRSGKLAEVEHRNDFAMMGRTYSTGHEPKLEWTLLERPIENVTAEKYRWHVWYPLRRTGAFAKLDPAEQGGILREHASIGFAYGEKELASDVRLACHGLDANDNEFVIGLVGHDLYPLSHLVQTMRKTKQTSEYISQMGPFFVGRVLFRKV